MLRMFVIRHGETEWNLKGLYQGQTDTNLTERGIRQAELTADALSKIKFEAIYSSPLKRAKDTAQKIAEKTGNKEIRVIDNLTEISHGLWEGKTYEEVQKEYPNLLKMWRLNPAEVVMPQGESLSDVKERLIKALSIIFFETPKGNVCIVSHDAVIKVLLCETVDAPLNSFWSFKVANGGISVIERLESGKLRLVLLNDTCHLGTPYESPEHKSL